MNPRIGNPDLLVHYTNGANNSDEEFSGVIETSFAAILSRSLGTDKPPGSQSIPQDSEQVASRLTETILRFSRVADAGEARANVVNGIRTKLLEFVERGVPVEAQILWSPKKHWKLGGESGVDLAELAALQTLVSINTAAQSVYQAGVSFLIDFEDIEFQFMEGSTDGITNAQETYMSGMNDLLSTLGLNKSFKLRRMSERAGTEEQLSQWRQQMKENHRALAAFWFESEQYPVSHWEKLRTFEHIHRLGWKGTIPGEMRRYYLDRLGKLTGVSDADKVDMVLRNLAGILLHHQVGLLCGSDGSSSLKVSFVRPATGAPAELRQDRIDIRFAPRKLCSRISAAGPWATKGFVSARRNKVQVSFRGWHELGDNGFGFAEGWLTIAGPNGSAKIRADLGWEKAKS